MQTNFGDEHAKVDVMLLSPHNLCICLYMSISVFYEHIRLLLQHSLCLLRHHSLKALNFLGQCYLVIKNVIALIHFLYCNENGLD